MYTNNYYYKLICETLIGEQIEGHHPDIYYLELILGYYDITYQTVKCKGKYLKDWYIALTHQTVSKSHPNVYYLRLIANFLTNTVLPWRTENYYLRLITRTVIREVYQITLSEANNKTILSYADSDTASLQATLTHGGVAVPDNPITFFTGVANTYNTQTRLNEDWSNGFKIRVEGDSKTLIIGNGTSTQIYYRSKSANNVEIITNGQKVAIFNCGDWLKYDNGVLYGSNGNSLDISSYNIDFTKNIISGGTLYRDVIDVATTDNTGKATVTYNSQGVGDIGFKAEWSTFVSETYAIEDCYYYDASSSSNVSKYTTNNNSISYDSTQQAYLLTHSPSTPRGILLNDATFTNKVRITAKLKYIATVTNNQYGIGLYNGSSMAVIGKPIYAQTVNYYGMSIASNDLTSYGTDNGLVNLTSSDFNTTDWYTIELIINETNITFKLYKGDTLVNTSTATLSVLNSSGNKLAILTGHVTNTSIYLKDIKVKPLPPSIELSASSDIISYADSDTTTLTATHSDGTGKTVKLYKQLGSTPNPSTDTLVGTMTDNNDGTYSYTYSSIGAGDTSFYATDGKLVSESFVISDDWYYDTGATDKGHWNIQSQVTATYDSSYGLKIVGNASSDVYSPLNITYPSEYSVEYEITDIIYGTYGYCAGFICEGVSIIQNQTNCLIETLEVSGTQQSFSKFSVGDKVKFEYENNQVKVYINNTLKGTWNPNSTYTGVKLRTYNGWGIGLKNLEIKPL